MKNKYIQFCLMTLLIFTSCSKKTDGSSPSGTTTTTTDGSQTIAQLAGSGSACDTLSGVGTALSGTGATRLLTLNTDGTYAFAIYFSDHSGCVTSQNTGGNNIATYSQSGTFALSGTAGTPTTGTKITFTVGAASMTAYPTNATSQAFRDWMNTCTPSPAFTGGATTSSRTFTGVTCATGSPNYIFTNPANVSATALNIVYNDGSGTFQSGTRVDVWRPGTGSFPAAYFDNYLTWH